VNTSKIKDADLRKVEPALMRAAAQARRIAAETNTPLILYEKGRVIRQTVVRGGIYTSPSLAGAKACQRTSCNGWTFWQFERAPGDWVQLNELRQR
jgi:hypothetical protein